MLGKSLALLVTSKISSRARKERDLKRIALASLCLLLLALTACSAPAKPVTAPPTPAETVSIEEWAQRYPNEYNDWKDSVHGVAYLAGNKDAPGCTDCHGDPASGEFNTSAFRAEIPSRCARCHDNEQMMAKYQVATDAYDTYLPGYHGTTIEYYRANDPTSWRYEAVCSDCHQAHAIYKPDDPRSSVAPANLLQTCQKCHPGAQANFAAPTNGHFRTTRAASRLVFYVGLFYKILIPLVIGAMLFYIVLDIVHRVRKSLGGHRS